LEPVVVVDKIVPGGPNGPFISISIPSTEFEDEAATLSTDLAENNVNAEAPDSDRY
jgi:hypothetical protein